LVEFLGGGNGAKYDVYDCLVTFDRFNCNPETETELDFSDFFVIMYIYKGAVMLCGWEGNRRLGGT